MSQWELLGKNFRLIWLEKNVCTQFFLLEYFQILRKKCLYTVVLARIVPDFKKKICLHTVVLAGTFPDLKKKIYKHHSQYFPSTEKP